MSALHGLADEFFVGGIDGLIEGHVNIGANFPLSLHGNFGIHADFVAVNMRLESDAIVINFGIRKREHLKTAGISKGWTVPASKFGEAASFFDKVWTWGENKMISVGENALAAEFAHLGMGKSFDGGTSGGANKGWRFNVAVWGVNSADAHEAGLFFDIKSERHVGYILTDKVFSWHHKRNSL